MFRKNSKFKTSIKLILAFILVFASLPTIHAKPEIEISLSQDEISYDQSTVVSFSFSGVVDDNLSEYYIDASELGYEKKINVDPLLNEQTLSVSYDIEPGEKELEVVRISSSGSEIRRKFSLNVLDQPLAENDFSWDEAIIYFVLTDRFYNGDLTNDDPNGENYDKSHFETYHGGDFAGLIEKLDYLEELGVNTIWITPIVDNIDFNLRHGKDAQYGYHGYWAKDFTVIDEHLGDLDTFHELIDQASERGIKIMLDVVINHAGYGMKTTDQSDVKKFPTADEQAVFEGMLRLEPLGSDLVKGELSGLPDFMTEIPEVREQVIEWQRAWIDKSRTEKGNSISYFRVDTVKHVESTSLKALQNEVVKTKPDFKMIGEFFDGNIFVNGNTLDGGGMDGVLDFEFKEIARNYLRGNFSQAEKQLKNRNQQINNTRTAGQFLSSHDEHGFLKMRLGGDEGLFKIAASLQLTSKGQPVIYYGEEIGQSGVNAGNMDAGEFSENRYDFDWSRIENNDILDHYKKLLSIRNNYSKLFARGDRESIYADKNRGLSLFERSLDDDYLYVALNIKDQPTKLKIKANQEIKNLYDEVTYPVGQDSIVELELPAKDEGGTAIFLLDSKLDDLAILETSSEEPDQDKAPDEDETKDPEVGGEAPVDPADQETDKPANNDKNIDFFDTKVFQYLIVGGVILFGYYFFFVKEKKSADKKPLADDIPTIDKKTLKDIKKKKK